MKLNISLLVILILISEIVFSQQQTRHTIDSLLLEDKQSKIENKAKLERYEKIYKGYIKLDKVDSVEAYVNHTIYLSEKLKLPQWHADAYYHLGFYFQGKGKYIEAENVYNLGLAKALEIGNKELYAEINENMGAMYANLPDYNKALQANLEAVKAFNELNAPVSMAGCYVNIADAYKHLNQYKSAISYLEQAAAIFKQNKGNDYGLAMSYADLGAVYYLADETELEKGKAQMYDVSLSYLDKALEIATQIKEPSLLGSIYHSRAQILSLKKNPYQQVLDAYKKALEYFNRLRDKNDYAVSLLSLANYYIDNIKYQEAAPILNEVLIIGRSLNLSAIQRDAHLAISKMAEQQHEYSSALESFKSFLALRDQIINEEKEREITRKRLQLDFLIKENNYKSQQRELSLVLQKSILEAKERKQELTLKDKEIKIQQLTFLHKQTILEREKLQKDNELERQRLNANLERKSRDEKILIQENKVRINKNFSIFLIIIVLGVSAGTLIIYRAHKKTERLNTLVIAQKAELEELGKVKDRILGMVSHDMRAPVNSLMSFIKLLERRNLSQEMLKEYTLILKHTIGYTSSMMENLLNWAYSQMQGFKPELKTLKLNHLIQELTAAAESDAMQKHIQLGSSQNIIAEAYCDKNMLSLIIRNLLNNAIKFTPEGGQINVEVEQTYSHVKIHITDTGIGISEAQLQWFNGSDKTILSRSTAGTNSEKGIGLGLTLCKSFAEMMNASIVATSNQGTGSAFTLSIPSKSPN